MANNMFEKTMNACLESRRVASKGKVLKEADELIDQELGLFGDDEEEIINDELPIDPDLDPESDVKMGDFQDDIVVVVDPETPADTPVEDMPPVEEYVGDLTYRCPICGNTFFSETELHEGDECPVCADVPAEGFDLVGEIAESDVDEDKKDDEEKKDDKEKEDKKDEDKKDDEVDLIEIDETEVEEACEPEARKNTRTKGRSRKEIEARRPVRHTPTRRPRTMESRRPTPARRPTRRPMRPTMESRRPIRRPENRPMPSQRTLAERRRMPVAKTNRPVRPVMEARRPVDNRPTKLDERTFNVFLNKFIKENYKNARTLNVVGVKANKNSLVLECRLTLKSGKSRRVNFKCEGFTPNRTMTLRARDDGTFKCESKMAPIQFRCTCRNGVIKCEGMKYNFITVTEGKRAQIYGKYMNEARKPAQRPAPRRTTEKA